MKTQYGQLERIVGEFPESLKEFECLLKKGLVLALKEKGLLSDGQWICICEKLKKHD